MNNKDENLKSPLGDLGMKPILVIDNYDSFTYNLVHLINELGFEAVVWRNDKFALEDVAAYDKILLSPGPGIPEEAEVITHGKDPVNAEPRLVTPPARSSVLPLVCVIAPTTDAFFCCP